MARLPATKSIASILVHVHVHGLDGGVEAPQLALHALALALVPAGFMPTCISRPSRTGACMPFVAARPAAATVSGLVEGGADEAGGGAAAPGR